MAIHPVLDTLEVSNTLSVILFFRPLISFWNNVRQVTNRVAGSHLKIQNFTEKKKGI